VLAIWFHVFAAIGVLAPIAWGIGYRICRRQVSSDEAKRYGLLFLAISLPAMMLLLPAFLNPQDSSVMVSAGRGRLKLASLAGASEIMSGTGHAPLAMLVWVFAFAGICRLFWKLPVIGGGIVLSLAAYSLALVFLKPKDMHMPVVVCRYAIIVLPMLMIAAACGLETMTEAVRFLPSRGRATLFYAVGLLSCAGLFVAGPWLRVYTGRNSFTHHSAFHESYRPGPAHQFYVSQFRPIRFPVKREDVPAFYPTLTRTPEVKTVIEYPMVLGDHFNLLYFYQQVHGKRVMIGYIPQASDSPGESGGQYKQQFVGGNDTADFVLNRVPDRGKLQFRNLLDLTDVERVRASGADRAVLHKDLVTEWSGRRARSGDNPVVLALAGKYRNSFGPPVFEDDQLIVFNLKSAM
jgi:hypothetical protein